MSAPVAVLGAGAWGTTLSLVLAAKGRAVTLWEYFPDYARVLQSSRSNPKFLPGVPIPEGVRITSDLGQALDGVETAVMAVPSQRMAAVAAQVAGLRARLSLVVSASKGIDRQSLERMSQILAAHFPEALIGALSGPSHAEEVSRKKPCSLVAAADTPEHSRRIQDLFMTEWVRVYTSEDLIGVELGGALKNVIALAAGMVDGLELGDNAKAALVTRGLAEIRRLGVSLGASAETFSGLSGMGDLLVTCMSRHSRNRRVGEELGRGRRLADIVSTVEMVVEGLDTTCSTLATARRQNVEMPITAQVYRILYEDVEPAQAVASLMGRAPKPEDV